MFDKFNPDLPLPSNTKTNLISYLNLNKRLFHLQEKIKNLPFSIDKINKIMNIKDLELFKEFWLSSPALSKYWSIYGINKNEFIRELEKNSTKKEIFNSLTDNMRMRKFFDTLPSRQDWIEKKISVKEGVFRNLQAIRETLLGSLEYTHLYFALLEPDVFREATICCGSVSQSLLYFNLTEVQLQENLDRNLKIILEENKNKHFIHPKENQINLFLESLTPFNSNEKTKIILNIKIPSLFVSIYKFFIQNPKFREKHGLVEKYFENQLKKHLDKQNLIAEIHCTQLDSIENECLNKHLMEDNSLSSNQDAGEIQFSQFIPEPDFKEKKKSSTVFKNVYIEKEKKNLKEQVKNEFKELLDLNVSDADLFNNFKNKFENLNLKYPKVSKKDKAYFIIRHGEQAIKRLIAYYKTKKKGQKHLFKDLGINYDIFSKYNKHFNQSSNNQETNDLTSIENNIHKKSSIPTEKNLNIYNYNFKADTNLFINESSITEFKHRLDTEFSLNDLLATDNNHFEKNTNNFPYSKKLNVYNPNFFSESLMNMDTLLGLGTPSSNIDSLGTPLSLGPENFKKLTKTKETTDNESFSQLNIPGLLGIRNFTKLNEQKTVDDCDDVETLNKVLKLQ